MKQALLLAGIFCFLVAAMPSARASGQDQIDQGLAVSKAWIAQIDAAQYEESYNEGSQAMHDRVPEDNWVKVLKALRTLYGPVVSRAQVSHVYKGNGWEGAEGEFMIITYDTSFKSLPTATETIVLKWEDGKWRGAGYSAGPKTSPNSAPPPEPEPTTEIHTETHVTPPPPSSQ